MIHRDFSVFKYKQGIGFPGPERGKAPLFIHKDSYGADGGTEPENENESSALVSCHCHPVLLLNLNLVC